MNDNTTAISKDKVGYNKLHKLQLFIDALNDVLKRVYEPSKTVSVDEAMNAEAIHANEASQEGL